MNNEWKETMQQVADYAKLEKEQAAQTGNRAFAILFASCAASIVIQLIVYGGLTVVLGETVTLLVGGVAYLVMMLRHGLAEPASTLKEVRTGLLCSSGMTVVLVLRAIRLGIKPAQIARVAPLFFIGISLLGFALMKGIFYLNRKRKNQS